MLIKFKELEHTAFSDLTDAFPISLRWGNHYTFVIYSYDGNAILMEYMKNIRDVEMERACSTVYSELGQVVSNQW